MRLRSRREKVFDPGCPATSGTGGRTGSTPGWIRRWTNSPPVVSRWPRFWRLPELAGKHGGTTFPDATATAAMLQTLGASRLDPAEFTAWWDAVTPKPGVLRPRFGRRREAEVAPPLPPLLAAAHAAGWRLA